jgi:hypothetical protein
MGVELGGGLYSSRFIGISLQSEDGIYGGYDVFGFEFSLFFAMAFADEVSVVVPNAVVHEFSVTPSVGFGDVPRDGTSGEGGLKNYVLGHGRFPCRSR